MLTYDVHIVTLSILNYNFDIRRYILLRYTSSSWRTFIRPMSKDKSNWECMYIYRCARSLCIYLPNKYAYLYIIVTAAAICCYSQDSHRPSQWQVCWCLYIPAFPSGYSMSLTLPPVCPVFDTSDFEYTSAIKESTHVYAIKESTHIYASKYANVTCDVCVSVSLKIHLDT